ncbi:MAG TPA: sugar phosphate nucleotidyltransferase [Bryobacteraceae bacterium]|jgi:dTDP-glucose pyrophosphorylase
MWGIIPAAGKGSRIQPLAFSKELLPLTGLGKDNVQRPRAVSDFLVERLITGGARRLCFVISAEKSDILAYYSRSACPASVCYTVQPRPRGLCDAIFQALPVIDPCQPVLVGLPDTIWFPEDGFRQLDDARFSFLLFPVRDPHLFDSVEQDDDGRIRRIWVKDVHTPAHLIWGAFKMPGFVLRELFDLWVERDRADEYIGTLVTEWIRRGGTAWGVPAGKAYYDVGTMEGYLEAMRILREGVNAVAAGSAFE